MYKTKLLLITLPYNCHYLIPQYVTLSPGPLPQTLIFYATLIRLTYTPWLLCHGFADE